MTKKETFEQIYEKYGFDAMVKVWAEESIELGLILLQFTRHRGTRDPIHLTDIIKEIADVSVCLDQIKSVWIKESAIDEVKEEIIKGLPKKLGL